MTAQQKFFEFEGEDIESAIKNALKTLNVSRETIQIKVLTDSEKGLFDMEGRKKAKIKVYFHEKKN